MQEKYREKQSNPDLLSLTTPLYPITPALSEHNKPDGNVLIFMQIKLARVKN